VANRKNLATDLMLPVKMLEYTALDILVVAPRLNTINYYFRDGMVSSFKPTGVESLSSVVYSLCNNPLVENGKREWHVSFQKSTVGRHIPKNLSDIIINC